MWCGSTAPSARAQVVITPGPTGTPTTGGSPVILGPDTVQAGKWATYQASNLTWDPLKKFWTVTGADSVAGITSADLHDDHSFLTPGNKIEVLWQRFSGSGKVEVRLGDPVESSLLAALDVAIAGEDGPVVTIIGPDTVDAGQPAVYTVAGLTSWSEDYLWHVEGADSIQGVPLWNYQDDGSFRTDGAEVTVYWDTTASSGMVSILANPASELRVLAKLNVLVGKANGLCDHHINADPYDYGPSAVNNPSVYGTHRNNGTIVSPGSLWVYGISQDMKYHAWTVQYFTEQGHMYEEKWDELNHPTAGNPPSRYPAYAPALSVEWYQQVPPVSSTLQTKWTLTSTYTTIPFGATERVVSAWIQARSQGADRRSLCFTDNKVESNNIWYSVIPLKSVTLNTPGTSLCPGSSVQARGYYDPYQPLHPLGVTHYEFQWRAAGSNTVLSDVLLPATPITYNATVQVPYNPSLFRLVPYIETQLMVPVNTTNDPNVILLARPVRQGLPSGVIPIDWQGSWVASQMVSVPVIPPAPTAMSLDNQPPVVTATAPSNVLRILPVVGATAYNYVAYDDLTGNFVTSLLKDSGGLAGSWDCCSYTAQPFVVCRFQTAGTYRIEVQAISSQNGCTQWGPAFTYRFTVGIPATCPTAYYPDTADNLPVIKPDAPGRNGTGQVWLPANTFNMAWAYSFSVRPVPNGFRQLKEGLSTFNPVSNQWEADLKYTTATQNLPKYYEYYIDLTVNAGSGQTPKTCPYWYEDNFFRPGRPGASDGGTVARLSVFPNPATAAELTISTPVTGRCQWVKLYDQQGNLVREVREDATKSSDQLILSVRQLLPGLYTVRAFDGERVVSSLVSRQ